VCPHILRERTGCGGSGTVRVWGFPVDFAGIDDGMSRGLKPGSWQVRNVRAEARTYVRSKSKSKSKSESRSKSRDVSGQMFGSDGMGVGRVSLIKMVAEPTLRGAAWTLVCGAVVAGLIGCGTGTFSPVAVAGHAIQGRLVGGQQPVTGASIVLYAAGAAGNGAGAVNLLRNPVVTAADGGFDITGDFTCPAATTQVYLVGSGGNPGLTPGTNNAASVMVAALGDCGNLTAANFVSIDEVTTVAAAWALGEFMGPNAQVGASPTNATGLRNAFLVANSLANTSTGAAGGRGLPAGAEMEVAKEITLADAVAGCVNTAGTAGCAPLFGAATNGGVAPTNTLDAALAIVRHPGTNVQAVFNAVPTSAPFQPTLTRAPNDWTMSITYTGGGIAMPTGVALDSTGAVWVANYSSVRGAGTVTKLSATGVPAAAGGFADAALFESYGITVDPFDNAWVSNEESAYQANAANGTLSKFSSNGSVLSGAGISGGGLYFPYALASDANGNIWTADFGRSRASLLDNSGNTLIGAGYSSAQLPLPLGVAVDAAGDAWFAAESSAVKVTRSGTITNFGCCSVPSAIALDAHGAVWVSDYGASALVQLSPGGAVLQTLTGAGGLYYPESVAIDGAGAAWAANFHGGSVSAFQGAAGGAVSAALSPGTGFGVDAGMKEPFGTAVDASGNLWVTDFGGSAVVEFVGVAGPVKTPLVGPPGQP
jgi:sugar lactone lactonase YvrE